MNSEDIVYTSLSSYANHSDSQGITLLDILNNDTIKGGNLAVALDWIVDNNLEGKNILSDVLKWAYRNYGDTHDLEIYSAVCKAFVWIIETNRVPGSSRYVIYTPNYAVGAKPDVNIESFDWILSDVFDTDQTELSKEVFACLKGHLPRPDSVVYFKEYRTESEAYHALISAFVRAVVVNKWEPDTPG